MIRRPPRSTPLYSSAASDVYKRQGMGLAAAACTIIGIAPGLLYNRLPYPVEFHPYTVPHLVSTMQLLLFATLGFYLLLGLLKSQATISMDTDWFYHRLRPAAF